MVHSRRRIVFLISLLAVFVLLLAACGGAPTAEEAAEEAPAAEEAAGEATEEPAEEEEAEDAGEEAALGSTLIGEIEGPTIITDEAAFPTEFNEAPMLAEKVEAGELPPLAERLPAASDLLVIEPVHEIGKYGGIWRRGFTGPADGQNGHRVAAGDRFLFWNSESFPEMTPNVAKSWEVSEDGTEITLNLREGMKWSDGEPFTTADVMFWFEHMYQNEEIVPVGSPFFNIEEGATLEAVDDYTLKFTFPFANSLFV